MRGVIKIKIVLLSFVLFTRFCLQSQTIITTISDTNVAGFSGDGGLASLAKLDGPVGTVFDTAGNLYFADSNNHRVRKISTSGIITTVAGNGIAGFSGDGGLAINAQLNYPSSIAFDVFGNILIADCFNNRIRKINVSGIISTVSGNGTASYTGDGGPATLATLSNPIGMAFDALGNLFVADQQNNCIRKISTTGTISTFAGNGISGYSGDGGSATSANLFTPSGICFDGFGNLLIADLGNHVVRKVNVSNVISTIAGNGTAGYTGNGSFATLATLNYPIWVTTDANGDLYIAEVFNHCIRKVNTSGIISTVVGTGVSGFSGDGGPPTFAQLKWPYALTFNSNGDMYIADTGNNRIRMLNLSTGVDSFFADNILMPYPNPCYDKLYFHNNADKIKSVKIFNSLSSSFIESEMLDEFIDVSSLRSGIYFVRIDLENSYLIKKIVKL